MPSITIRLFQAVRKAPKAEEVLKELQILS